MRVCLCLLLLAALVESPKAAIGTLGVSTAFRVGPHHEPIVEVEVNGSGPFLFILDTGSTHTSIGDRLAAILDTPAVAKTNVTTSLGDTVQPVVRLDRLAIGPVVASDVLATEVSEHDLDTNDEIHGVLGQDILSGLVYTLDFAARRVEWNSRTPPPAQSSILTLRDARGRFLAELPQHGSTLWLVPDSGAEGLVLYERPSVKLPPLTRHPGHLWLSTLSDRQAVETARVEELRVGRTNLTDVPAVLVKRSDADASSGDGLLPVAMFTRVTFDGPGRRLTVEP